MAESLAQSSAISVTAHQRFYTSDAMAVRGRPKVLLTGRVAKEAEDLLLSHADVLLAENSGQPIKRDMLLQMVKGVDGIMCMLRDSIDVELLEACGPQLKVVSNTAVGYDNIDIAACKERGVAVGNTPGVLTGAVADLTIALVLAATRRLAEGVSAVKNGHWGTWSPSWMCGVELCECTVGIIGLGRIGQAVASRLNAFGVDKLLYAGPREHHEVAKPLGATYVALDELFKRADVVIITCALTAETRGLVSAQRLAAMKSTAVLVNTARGAIVDQQALLEALDRGHLAGAALDVCTPEPLASTDPLLAHPNVIVLPHIGSATVKTRRDMALLAVKNVLAGVSGRDLPKRVV